MEKAVLVQKIDSALWSRCRLIAMERGESMSQFVTRSLQRELGASVMTANAAQKANGNPPEAKSTK